MNLEYRCLACDKPVQIPTTVAWPEQCPHCQVWQPVFTTATAVPAGGARHENPAPIPPMYPPPTRP